MQIPYTKTTILGGLRKSGTPKINPQVVVGLPDDKDPKRYPLITETLMWLDSSY